MSEWERYNAMHEPFEKQASELFAQGALGDCKWCGKALRPLLHGDIACSGTCGWVGVVRPAGVIYFDRPISMGLESPAGNEPPSPGRKPILCRLGRHRRNPVYKPRLVDPGKRMFVVDESCKIDYLECYMCHKRLGN